MARLKDRTSAPILVRRPPAPCPVGGLSGCNVKQVRLNGEAGQGSRYTRWEAAIGRLQEALACSPDCPLADILLKTVCDLSRRQNPLAEVCPELDPAPNRTSTHSVCAQL